MFFLNLLSGDNNHYTESPLNFLATEVEDIGQDIVFFPNQLEEDVSKSEILAKGSEELIHAQTATPIKLGSIESQSQTLVVPSVVKDFQHSATPSSETFNYLSTVETFHLIEQDNYPESYQPKPEENLHVNHEESHVLPTSSYQEIATEEVVAFSTVSPTTDETTLATAGTSGHHPSATKSLHMWASNAWPVTEVDQLFSGSSMVPQEGDLPVVQEDQTTPVITSEPTTEPKLVSSFTFQHVNVQSEGGDDSDIDEDLGAHFNTTTPPVLHSLHTEDFDNETENYGSTIESSTTNHVDAEEQPTSTEKPFPTAADSSTAGK